MFAYVQESIYLKDLSRHTLLGVYPGSASTAAMLLPGGLESRDYAKVAKF